MTTKEKIAAIGEILFSKEEVKMAQQKLEDGITIVEYEALEAGQSIGIVSEDGIVAVPASEDPYVLDDGKTFTVVEDGIIAEVGEKKEEGEEEEVEEEKVEEEMSEEKPVKKIVESVSKETFYSKEDMEAKDLEITELKAKIAELETTELSKEEEVELAKPITHNPENKKEVEGFKFGSANGSAMSRIFDRIK